MPRPARYLLYALGGGLLLLLATIAAVALLVEPDDYRDDIAAAVGRATGRELVLGGPLGLGLWPCCSLSLSNASLGNPPGFAPGTFIAVQSASLGFRLWPLLAQRRLSVHQITLEGLEANLITDAAGNTNWTFDGTDSPAPPADAAAAEPLQLDLAGISVRDGAITWQDARDGTHYAVAGLALDTGPLGERTPVPVSAAFVATDRQDDTRGDVRLQATAILDPDAATATLATPVIDLTLQGPALPFAEAVVQIKGDELKVDYGAASRAVLAGPAITATLGGGALPFSQGQVTVAGTALQIDYGAASRATLEQPAIEAALRGGDSLPGDTTVALTARQVDIDYAATPVAAAFVAPRGEATATGTATLPALRGTFSAGRAVIAAGDTATRLQLPGLKAALVLSGEPVPGGQADVEASVQALDLVTGPLLGRFDGLTARLAAAGATAEVTGAGRFGTRNDLAGAFTLARVSPRELLAKLAPPAPVTADPKALTALAGRGRWAVRGEVASLDDLAVTLDDSTLTGSLARTLGDVPRTRFDLRLDRIILDRYLEPDAPAATGAQPATQAPTELPVGLIRDLRLDGRARIGQLGYDGLQLAEVDVTLAADGGQLRLDPLRARLYGGSLAGSIGVDAREEAARVSVRQQLRDVQLGAFLTDFADVRNITGRVSADADLAGRGTTDAGIKRSLDGRLSLGITDGLYKGVDLWYEIRRARALLRQDAVPARTGEPATPLQVVELAGPVARGVLTSEKFVAGIPFVRLTGKLSLDMPAEQVRGDLQAAIFETPTFDDGTALPDLVGARLPLTIDGPLAAPKVRVDFSKMVREAVRETAKEQLKGLQDKMLERLGLGAPAPPPEGEQPPAEPPPKKKESSGDRLRKSLEQLIKPPS